MVRLTSRRLALNNPLSTLKKIKLAKENIIFLLEKNKFGILK